MDAYVTRLYRKEEEFLEDWYLAVDELLPRLGAEWRPNFRCNDLERHARRLRLHAGQLDALTFDEAVIFHDKGQFASLHLHLRSSARLLIVRLTWAPGMVVETLLDCCGPVTPRPCS
jgi:hypothetical protein